MLSQKASVMPPLILPFLVESLRLGELHES